MRIIIWSTPLIPAPPPSYGGLEYITGLMAQELDERGIETHLIAPEGSYVPKNGSLLSTGKEMEVSEQQVYEKYKDKIKELCDDETVIWDNTWANFGYLLKVEKPNIKVCSTFHGMNPHRSVPFPKMNLICCSQAQALVFSESYGIDVKYVYHGIDLDQYRYNEDKEDFFFFLSRLFPPKGAHKAIQLCNKLKKPLKVAGGSFGDDKQYMDFIKHLCEKSDYCELLGEIDHETKVDLYSRAKATLVPLLPFSVFGGVQSSVWVEIFGLYMVESLQSGGPVITGNSGATREVLINEIGRPVPAKERVGFVCQGDVDYEWAIENVDQIKPKDCLERAQFFSKERMASQYIENFQDIIDGKEW